jgi:hypothetical protein
MSSNDRVFNQHGRRHHRKTYSLSEVRAGVVIVAGLVGVAAWVGWRGSQADPALFAISADLLDPGVASVSRGALPEGLAAEGWREGKISVFDPGTLYKKINGRAGYFEARGFVSMVFVTLSNQEDPDLSIDIEFYDLAQPENALGAYVGEKDEEIESKDDAGSHWHIDRNALFLARGQYYARAIGTAENATVEDQLKRIESRLSAKLESGEQSWAEAFFADHLGVASADVTFERENAFSFELAKNVYSAATADGESDLFVSLAVDETTAQKLATDFVDGFASLGKKVEIADGAWVKDRYLGALSTARVEGRMVYGVRFAPTSTDAKAALERLREAVVKLPAEALPASPTGAARKPSASPGEPKNE